MTYYKISFRVEHDCPYSSFSKENPDDVISHWCNWSRDVIEIHGPKGIDAGFPDRVDSLLRDLGSKVIRRTSEEQNVQVILQHCSCDALPPPTLPVIEEHECLEIQPRTYAKGWEYYQVLAFSGQDVNGLVEGLYRTGQVEIISRTVVKEDSVHDSLMVSTSSILGQLTGRQAWAMLLAFENGYYDLPRRSNAEEIALRAEVPRTSYIDHLRKAEGKVITAIIPYLRMKALELPSRKSAVTRR